MIRSVAATLVMVPMRRALGTSAMGIAEAPLVLIDLHTDEGITGRAYLFCYLESAGHAVVALARDVNAVLAGTEVSPAAVRRELGARFKLPGARGLVAAVAAGVDVACWDALAIAAGLPLARMLGAPMRPTSAYNSNGLGLLEPAAAAAEAQELVAEGFLAIKMRLGRPSGDDDLAAVRAVRAAVGPDVVVMSDYNQALSANAARERCRQLDDEGLAWIEEPVRHDDYATSAELAALLRTPVQIGENFTGPRAMSAALASKASDLVMPDVDRIGWPRPRWRTHPGPRCRPTCTPKSALTCSPPRQRPTGSSTWTGPTPSSSSRWRWLKDASCRQIDPATGWPGIPMPSRVSGAARPLAAGSAAPPR
jgi:mandelate racemase